MRDDDATNLLHLIRFGLAARWLKIEDLGDALACEYVVITACALVESEVKQQRAEILKPYIRI